MIRAYDEAYLDDAMKNLGEAFDYAANACQISMDEFFTLFIGSGFAEQFERGVPQFVAGKSGTELAMDALSAAFPTFDFPKAQVEFDYSPQYWCGWILAFYQWYTGRSFKNIRQYISMHEIERLYLALHEASELKFVDTINNIIRAQNRPTRLQEQRKLSGLSQRKLAEKVGVNLRTLQQYEIRAKDINKAAGSTLLALSRALGCRMEDLLEYDTRAVGEGGYVR